MRDIIARIETFGGDPTLVGLATLGGVIALFVYPFLVLRFLWRQRRRMATAYFKMERALLLGKAREQGKTRSYIKVGFSETLMILEEQQVVYQKLVGIIANCTVAIVQFLLYVKDSQLVFAAAGVAAMAYVLLQSFAMNAALARMHDRFLYKQAPAYWTGKLRAEIRVLQQRKQR